MIRAFQWDLARQVERLDVLLALLPRYAAWGYQELYLHLEDAVDYPSLPGVARADAYTWPELQRLVTAARAVGIGVVPIVNLLGHTQYLIKTPQWRDLNELRGPDGTPKASGQLCPLHERIPELVERLLKDTAPLCTAGKLHVGLDESFHLGKCPRCAREVAKRGLAHHFASHATRLHKAVSSRGLRMGLWADMLAFLPEAIPLLPKGLIAYDWYYYPFNRKPRIEFHNFKPYDLAPALRCRGIDYWGCPMSGAFRYEPLPIFGDRLENLRSWWRRCEEVKADGFLVTSWEAYRLAFEMPVVVDAAAATFWLERRTTSTPDLLARGFARLYGSRGAKRAARTAASADKYPFSGYYSWETNQRWEGGVTADSPSRLRQVARHFAGISAEGLPPSLAASLRLRSYFAERDVFVREAAETVLQLRRGAEAVPVLLRAARALNAFLTDWEKARGAAETMWTSTRSPDARHPNAAVLEADLTRARAWGDWLDAVRREPRHAFEASTVFGKWRLQFIVELTEPAVQRISVEQRKSDGNWVELAARHTIEFQAAAAVPRTPVSHPFCVPLEARDTPLRLVMKGTGRVHLRDVAITNGVQTDLLTLQGRATGQLGRKAPNRGFPDPTRVSDCVVLIRRLLG